MKPNTVKSRALAAASRWVDRQHGKPTFMIMEIGRAHV